MFGSGNLKVSTFFTLNCAATFPLVSVPWTKKLHFFQFNMLLKWKISQLLKSFSYAKPLDENLKTSLSYFNDINSIIFIDLLSFKTKNKHFCEKSQKNNKTQ